MKQKRNISMILTLCWILIGVANVQEVRPRRLGRELVDVRHDLFKVAGVCQVAGGLAAHRPDATQYQYSHDLTSCTSNLIR